MTILYPLKRFIFLTALLIATHGALLAQQTLGFNITSGAKKIEIPFENYNNLIVVPIVLNNAIPLKFVVDTGVRTAILTERTFSDLLNIAYNRKITLVGADGDRGVDAYIASNISLQLPGVIGSGQAMLVLEEDYLELKKYLGTEVHGILGYEIFSRFVVKIDYIGKIITLYEPKSFKPRKRFTALSLSIEDTKPYIQTKMQLNDSVGFDAKLMIDTGASHSLLLDIDSHVKFVVPDQKVRSHLGRGLGGDINGYIARIKALEMGPFEFTNIIASMPDSASFGEIFRKTGRQGTMGGGILNKFTVIMDYFNEKIYLRKNRAYKIGSEFNMSGIDLIADGEDLKQVKILNVKSDSPAAKGDIKVGDEIILINGHRASDLNLSKINNLFRTKPGKKIRLRIKRNGKMLKKEFRLERLV